MKDKEVSNLLLYASDKHLCHLSNGKLVLDIHETHSCSKITGTLCMTKALTTTCYGNLTHPTCPPANTFWYTILAMAVSVSMFRVGFSDE